MHLTKFRVHQHTIPCIAGIMIWMLTTIPVYSQVFSEVTDSDNPIVSTTMDGNYSGAAWIDFDSDGDLDLFHTKNFLFRNDGGGDFVLLDTEIGDYQIGHLGNGASWADFDNNGTLDCALAATPSMIFKNLSDASFAGIVDGEVGLDFDNTGWTCAWGDYNSDGFVDLLIVNPSGFLPSSTPCHLFLNQWDGRFERVLEFEFTQLFDAYTVGSWSDYDDDGDLDLFIASGPAGSPDEDNLFDNTLTQSGTASFNRITNSPIGTDLQDGQVWNWIDYDNDRDLDAYITNYGGAPNRLYRNNNGTLESISDSPLFLSEASLANTWGDLDNDGDLDCIVTNESGASTHYFQNQGDGTFSSETNAFTVGGATRGATLGDYDNDGDLDLFITGPGGGLYRNDTDNGNNWVNLSLAGTVSNHSAIGAKVHVLSTIGGSNIWQRREISAQNSFNSHNSLRVHFGLGDAATIDSMLVHWPSGQSTTLTDVSPNQFLTITEEIPEGFLRANFTADQVEVINADELTVEFTDISYAEPNHPVLSYEWDFDADGIIDATDASPTWSYTGSDTHTVSLKVITDVGSDEIIRENYIKISGLLPILEVNTTSINLGMIDQTITQVDTSFYVHNVGMAADSVVLSIDPVNLEPADAMMVSPSEFALAAQDSVKVSVTIYPPLLAADGPFYTPFINIDSRFGYGETHFEKEVRFRVISSTNIDQPGDDSTLPATFELLQNYPNPFNPSTRIRFGIPKPSEVSIQIFDIRGQYVTTLVHATLAPGYHDTVWEGRDKNGKAVASGLYFSILRANGASLSRKLILMK